jgi:hypothetical protein
LEDPSSQNLNFVRGERWSIFGHLRGITRDVFEEDALFGLAGNHCGATLASAGDSFERIERQFSFRLAPCMTAQAAVLEYMSRRRKRVILAAGPDQRVWSINGAERH